jgi:hypothetical protein
LNQSPREGNGPKETLTRYCIRNTDISKGDF